MTLSRVNSCLLTLIILLNCYVILAPLLPALIFHLNSHKGEQQRLQRLINQPQTPAAVQAAGPQPNHVVIPSMLLNQPIYDGPESQQYKILDKGIWRFSWGSTPDKGGNTVLVGHRFTYTNPRGVFYYLNKVALGDEIAVWWSDKEYVYKVASINQVEPTDTAIEGRSATPELTLFTCTPLWLPKYRLVVVADLEHAG